ncbi:Omega-hydroxypalmitate O-feruloyl transferase [Linum perenne]
MVEQNQSNVTQNPETTAFQLTVKKWNHCLVSPAETKFSDSRGNDAAGDVIKDALSKVLVHYYPLAGRVTVTPEGKFAVKCTGEGVVFVEAEANCALKDVDFSRPDKVTRAKLVVNEVPGVENKFDIPLAVQFFCKCSILWKPSTMVNLKVVLNLKVGEPTLVAPAEPTTKGIYFLSNVDDEPTIIRTLYCFKSSVKGNELEDACEVIKTALSNVLVHYYPLAGRMTFTGDGRRAIDCTREGVVFVEAEADCEMDKIVDLKKLDEGTRGKMVYDLHGAKTMMDYPPLMAQVTKFKCGGFVLGLAFSHFAADGMSAVEFVNSWGETARGIPLSLPPYLDRTMLKARTPLKIEHHHQEYDSLPDKSSQVNGSIPYEEVVYNFVQFNPGMIDKIKQEISTDKKWSTFKALTAFVWRARTIALKMAHDQLTRVLVVVNARDKFEPPLPKGYFGNAIKFMPVTCLARELVNEPLSYAVGLIQDAIDRVDDGLLRSTIDYYELTKADRSLGFTCISSAWGGLAFGSTNFGWGEPVATGPVELPVDEGMLFLREYESMYAYIGLPVSAMNTFQELVQQI